jgi:nucleoside-diphosphate-sugar epimerase
MAGRRITALNVGAAVIFGGTGCIGTHLALHLLQNGLAEDITLADIRPLRGDSYTEPLRQAIANGKGGPARIRYVECDVRRPLCGCGGLPTEADLIVNLAAVHREPGHQPNEYYETNIPGAENVCAYAVRAGCGKIVFTSSISPYGSSDAARDEDSLPVPETPYGGSKLVAEKIHMAWQAGDSGRRLIVLRPGVVFGPGEHANVARLARSLANGYFVYAGNRKVRKAGVYVKELCRVFEFAFNYQEANGEPVLLWNVSMDPPPTVEDYVNSICATTGFRLPRLSIPARLLVGGSYPLAACAQFFGRNSSINPVRMKKLSQPTHIDPRRLREAGYNFRYTMEQAIADWKQDAPEDFRR